MTKLAYATAGAIVLAAALTAPAAQACEKGQHGAGLQGQSHSHPAAPQGAMLQKLLTPAKQAVVTPQPQQSNNSGS